MTCPVCHSQEALLSPFGVVPCADCQDRHEEQTGLPIITAEFIPDRIKEDRRAHAEDLIQPYRDGHLSKEYVDKYGSARLEVSAEEVKKAKNVWNGETTYYKN